MKIYLFVRSIIQKLPYPILRWIFVLKSKNLKNKFYNNTFHSNTNNYVVSIINEHIKNGGLSDRLNGIISSYHAAYEAKRPFKLLFNSPFNLELFLEPNEIDWHVDENELFWSKKEHVIVMRPIRERLIQRQMNSLISEICHMENSQIHIYSNFSLQNGELFNKYFNKLFRPSQQLQEKIDRELELIGQNYISITYRFQQLLGDFAEGNYPILNDPGKRQLIKESINRLISLHLKHPGKRILVTSDSKTFLLKARQFDFTYVVDGELVHMDYNNSSNFETHLKSFLDLFLISKAEIIYSVVSPPLYNSGFPKFASQINSRPFYLIK